MPNIFIAGIGTGVGKTVVSGIVTHCLEAEYWKPVECADETGTDTETIASWGGSVHPSAYSFPHPLSPHHAARVEETEIDVDTIRPPTTAKSLVIEGVGGVLVPLTKTFLTADLFSRWEGIWILVSRHYLGSINHTLLTIEVLEQRGVTLGGIVFNGYPKPDTEEVILERARVPMLGRVLPEGNINPKTLENYGRQWKSQIATLLP